MLATGYQGNEWISDVRGYSIRAGYQWLKGSHPPVPWYKDVWDSWTIPKHSVIGWLINRQALNTRDKLFHLGISGSNSCVMCDIEPETLAHLFPDCAYSKLVIKFLEHWLQMRLQTPPGHCPIVRRKVCRVVRLSCWYVLWMERNTCRVEMKIRRPELLASEIQKMAQLRIQQKFSSLVQQSGVNWVTSLGINV
ncbi:uncharacterized protein LOC141588397 [Silene latifolia]|uniref:uncharacterized protein LOC141588397 n=1 Tax=Silene latifolia TaxID=37657 RepID=UPI003D7877D6